MTPSYYFLVFSLLGWIIEALYRSMIARRLVNPGKITGENGVTSQILNIDKSIFIP